MLTLLFTILKLVGVLLLLVFILLLLLLFVPFRYRVNGALTDARADGIVRASWLLHLVSIEVCYHHGAAVSGRLCVCGIPVRRIEGSAE